MYVDEPHGFALPNLYFLHVCPFFFLFFLLFFYYYYYNCCYYYQQYFLFLLLFMLFYFILVLLLFSFKHSFLSAFSYFVFLFLSFSLCAKNLRVRSLMKASIRCLSSCMGATSPCDMGFRVKGSFICVSK